MFEEFNLTNLTIENKDTLPDMVRIGSFERKPELVPVFLPFASQNGFCFEINPSTRDKVHNQLQYIALSILMQVNPALLKLSIIDTGLSTCFPLIHRLQLTNVNFISNKNELKNELKRVSDNARYLSSNCLGYDFADLKTYNEKTDFKKQYNVLFISNFPKDFREEDVDLVFSLITEANKCGIYIIMSYIKDYFPEINTFNKERYANLQAIPKKMIHLDCTQKNIQLYNFNIQIILDQFNKHPFSFESYENTELDAVINRFVGLLNRASDKVKDFLSIPIGKDGNREIRLNMGAKSNINHCMIAGQTGTGKSTFLNLIITKIAEFYSSDEIRLFLLDYKEGVEFGIYKRHPNVECLLLDNSDFNYVIEVLAKFENEMKLRAQLFNKYDPPVKNIDAYNDISLDKLPRTILIVDEVQQLFSQSHEFTKKINQMLTHVAEQGRSFGIHMIFCTLTYADCKIDEKIKKQSRLRIAFQLSDSSDCRDRKSVV